MNNLFLIFLFGLQVTYSINVNADLREYNISVVIFEDTTSQYIHSEKWSTKNLSKEIIDDEIDTENDTTTITGEFSQISFDKPESAKAAYPDNNDVIQLTVHDSSLLNEQIEKLEKSKRYRILVNQSWRQVGLDENNAINIYVDSSKQESDKMDGNTTNLDSALQLNALNFSQKINIPSNISGDIKIVLARYLHFYSDLIYQKPGVSLSPINDIQNIKKDYLVKTHRRMRSKEIHYIDHPLVGILVLATPVIYEKPELDEE